MMFGSNPGIEEDGEGIDDSAISLLVQLRGVYVSNEYAGRPAATQANEL